MPNHDRTHVTSRLRLRGFDYASAASYFVTLCTQRRACLFGQIEQEEMQLSRAGVVMDSWWHAIEGRFPTVHVDAVVVMPNHLHGVLHLGVDPDLDETVSLGDVMQWFKTRTTYDYVLGVRLEGWPRFDGRLWQRGYHDRIIRNDRELERIRAYIDGNPGKWAEDAYHQP